jgi:hypothetical protein
LDVLIELDFKDKCYKYSDEHLYIILAGNRGLEEHVIKEITG